MDVLQDPDTGPNDGIYSVKNLLSRPIREKKNC